MILAIDPGTTESGWVLFHEGRVVDAAVDPNEAVLTRLQRGRGFHLRSWHAIAPTHLAIEMIASYGMPVGAEVFETCVWIGRFVQAWGPHANDHSLIYRKDVKMHLCGTPRAKDANIRQALIDKLGAPGTKKSPGPTYGVKSHAWAALGVAVTALERQA